MIEWRVSDGLTDYREALAWQEARAAAIRAGEAEECVWLLEHPPVVTAGTSARREDLIQPGRFPVVETGRGGQYTYHGPGQRVVYVMFDLGARGRDVRGHVCRLEAWIIRALAEFGVKGERRAGRVGVWVVRPERPPGPGGTPTEAKIAAIGVRVRRWVAFHGFSLNVEPDLDHFRAIVPCGIRDHEVTSLVDLGAPAVMSQVDLALEASFRAVYAGEGLRKTRGGRP